MRRPESTPDRPVAPVLPDHGQRGKTTEDRGVHLLVYCRYCFPVVVRMHTSLAA
jgi:hypothetical protein